MTGQQTEHKKESSLKGANQRRDRVIFDAACALVIGLFIWAAEPGVLELQSNHAQRAYYNLLVQGFSAGQLNLKIAVPPELAQMADPYDPANQAHTATVWDMSYYKGKLYIYYGVTPALVLYWPYEALTGRYLPDAFAIAIFLMAGFMIAARLIYSIWRRYFADVSVWVPAAGTFAMGAAIVALELGWPWYRVTEVAVSCGFTFSMLALLAVWRAMDEPKRPVAWLLLASLSYGLAVGARPSLLFGAIILMIPVARAWCVAAGQDARRRAGFLAAAAIGPITAVGLGLMLYNYLRFDNPFEFGFFYQVTSYRASTGVQFSPHYFWFDVWFYFLQPMQWSSHFPFLQLMPALTSLPPHYLETGTSYGGIMLVGYPMMWLALAAPLAWKSRPPAEASALRWFTTGAFLLFLICGVTICFYFCGFTRYELDFLPGLMVLSVIGILGLERAPVDTGGWRPIARWGWCLLLVCSLIFYFFMSVPKLTAIVRSVCWLFR